MSPKLSAFDTLFHTELSDNSPQPSGTIVVLKSVEIDPVDPGMNSFFFFFFFPLRPLKGGGGEGVFLPLPVTYYLFP